MVKVYFISLPMNLKTVKAMNTTENNKKLAIFMDNAIVDSNNNHKDTYNYHNDWNYLMEVVEKIYSLDIYYDKYIDYNSSMFSSGKIELSTNIKHVYNDCVEFVEWLAKEQEVSS